MKDVGWLACLFLLGLLVRLWGLGDISLHGDEETMALAARSILATGEPRMPSGMYYPRGMGQLYLMAGSAACLGESAWSWRLPSVCIGSLVTLIGYAVGRRFLDGGWLVLFVCTLTFHPDLIAFSQTARMYIFLVAFVMLATLFCLRFFERERVSDLIYATVSMLAGIHFIVLAILSSLVLVYPSCRSTRTRTRILCVLSLAVCAAFYLVFDRWEGSHFPITRDPTAPPEALSRGPLAWPTPWQWALIPLPLIGLSTWLSRHVYRGHAISLGLGWCAGVLGYLACVLLEYHLGMLLLVASTLWLRRAKVSSQLMGYGMLCLAGLLACQLLQLQGPWKETLKSLLGSVSVWPYLRFAEFFPTATACGILPLVLGLRRYAQGEDLPETLLLLLLAGLPVLLFAGYVLGDIPRRYTLAVVPFFLLFFTCGYRDLIRASAPHFGSSPRAWSTAVIYVILAACCVPPFALARNVHLQTEHFSPATGHRGADHQGAAAFMERTRQPGDVLIVEDVLQQTYYLGSVDYWLRSYSAGAYAIPCDGHYVDFYTHTRQLGTAAELRDVLDQRTTTVYVIGSGETAGQQEYFLGEDLMAALVEYDFETVFLGRDQATRILRLTPPNGKGH